MNMKNYINNKSTLRNLNCFLILFFVFLMTSCGGGSGNSSSPANSNSNPPPPTGAVLQTITVTSSSSSVAVGLTAQFTATGHFSDGTSQVIQSPIWSSSSTATTSISSTGLATALQPGTAVITASSNGVSGSSNGVTGSANLTITPAILQSIAITAPSVNIALLFTEQLTATGSYSDGTTHLLTAATWSSSAPSVATVNSTGSITSVATGSTTLSATANGITGSLTFNVTAATPVSISIVENYGTPNYLTQASIPTTLYLGNVIQLTPLVTYSDGSSMLLTLPVNSSSGNSVVTFDSSGLLTPVGPGTAVVSASFAGLPPASITFTVLSSPLTSVAISPSTFSIASGSTQALTATAYYSDGGHQVIQEVAAQPIVWSSNLISVVTVSQGIVTWVGAGSAVISATFGTKVGTASVTASP